MSLLALAQRKVDPALERVLARIGRPLPSDGPRTGHLAPTRLVEAMRYVLLAPGKRLRPALVFGGARAVGAGDAEVLPAACAVEMIHAYSLVHDDLPALDDDDLRRGRPTCHRAFDEATAILAGDALLTEALTLLGDPRPLSKRAAPPRPRDRVLAIRELGRAAGTAGMVGGQYDDIYDARPDRVRLSVADEREHLLSVHRRKTGRLIQASVVLGAIYCGAPARKVEALRGFGAGVGLAFQLVDDALDRDGISRIDGPEEARAQAEAVTREAIEHLRRCGSAADPLRELALAVATRRA